MGLFRRKRAPDASAPRCPVCRERLPEDADKCQMCGSLVRFAADVNPLPERSSTRDGEAAQAPDPR